MIELSIPPIALRNNRIQTAVKLGTPDRVPFMPMLGNIYALGYDVTIYDAMKDIRTVKSAMEKLLVQYDPDLLFAPVFFPIDVMEAAGSTNMRWPGSRHNLPLNTPYQFIDESFIQDDDDYTAFLKDPSQFMLNKILPRRYKELSGLSLLNVYGLCGLTSLSLAGAGIPPLVQALETLIKSARLAFDHIGGMTELAMHAVELGYPVFGNSVPLNPFDEFADCYRGLLATVTDLHDDPERVNEAVTRLADATIPFYVEQAKMMHAPYSMIPLHSGSDQFMSPDNYAKYYWPPLKRLINALVDADITPILICEGNYDTRIEQLTDVPKGKVIYDFEKVDMKRAKKMLSGTACIAGNLQTASLILGSTEQVIRETRQLLDDCAPGGGYIMSNSIALDNADHNLLEAWHRTTLEYGKY